MPDDPRVLSDFSGCWFLHRSIEHTGGPPATFTGHAKWTPQDYGLLYHETGELCVAGHVPMKATRQYQWHFDLRIYFDDGRFFHQVPASGGQTAHWCDPDHYDVTYDFTTWPAFQVIWQVNGPRKGYTMTSRYNRTNAK